MSLLPPLEARRREPEVMDMPDLEEARHFHALRSLARINLWTTSVSAMWKEMANVIHARRLCQPRVLDIATGGGDVPIRLWRMARRQGLGLQVDGCDVNPRAVEFARQEARRTCADVGFFPMDALAEALPREYDFITCSLFLHHLGEGQSTDLLRKMAEAARHAVLVDDLQRVPSGYLLALFGTRMLSRSRVVHVDAPLSVRAAYNMEEAAALAQRAGLRNVTVRPHWPFRYLLAWKRK